MMGSEEPAEQSKMRPHVGVAFVVKSYLRTHRSPSPRGGLPRSGFNPIETSSRWGRGLRPFAPIEFRSINPHAMQDHGDLAR